VDPVSPAILAKWAGPVASRFAVNGIGRLTHVRRVARVAAKKAAAAGVLISKKSLRTWLSQADTAQQLRQCTEHSLAQTAERLTFLVPGSDAEQRRADALRVLQMVMQEYVRLSTPTEAALVTGDWGRQTTVEDGARTRETVQELHDDVLGRLDARTDFEDALRTLSPWSAQEARRLVSAWPAVETVVGLLPDTGTGRRSVVQQWADQEPVWLRDAPPQVFSWLGQIASDYAAQRASLVFLERCIRGGGFPRDFLVARAALQAGSGTEQEIRDYLAGHRDTASPLLDALRAYLDRDWAGCLEHLGLWEPHDAMAQAMKVQLEAETLLSMGREGEALAQLRTAEKGGMFTGLGLRLAHALLQRAVHVRSQNKLAHAQEALAVAVRARNSRRAWHGDSAAATVVAVQAAVLSQDLSKAWSLTQPPPEGEALPHEAADSRLREQTALVAALSGREREAKQSLADMTNAFAKVQVLAMLAECRLEGDTENPQVRTLWQQAWDAAQSEPEQLTAAMGLAEAGADLPDLEHLRVEFPDAVAEIELLARALRSSFGEQLAVLRANITRHPLIVLKLAQRYYRRGDVELAAQTLKDGADHWRDPRLMAMAASHFREAGAHPRARDCADAALKMAGPGWAGQGRMYALLVEVESADGRMERATDAALSLLALDPQDPDARWALVKCYATRALVERAWQTLTEQGAPLDPRSRDEALLWVELGARLSTDPHFTGRALTLMQHWPEEEELLGRFLNALHLRAVGTTEPLSEQEGKQLRNATSSYLERFPDSSVLRAVAVGPQDNLLENVADELRRAHQSTKEVLSKIINGELPVGVLTWATGRTYGECCMRRAAGVVYAADFPTGLAETQAAQAAWTGRTVLDTTAAVTLALLDRQVSEPLIGYVQAVMTTDQLLADALRAKESLALQSELTLGWDERSGSPAVSSSTPEQMAALRATATRLVEIMQATTRVSRPELRSFPPLPGGPRGTQWMTAIDYAKEHGLLLWCDDRVMRALARTEGVAAFGTLTLIDACHSAGLLASPEAAVIKAELLRNYFVDIPFSTELYYAAAQADGWRAKAVAMALSRPTPWSDPQAAARFALDAASQAVTSMPDETPGWLGAAYAGLHRASLPSHRQRNLHVLCWQILTQPWISASSLPFTLAGLHAGIQAVADTDAALKAALTQYYGTLVEQMGHIAAASSLMRLFALTDERDKATAARTVLTYTTR
jgi:tetratricopeptide (TPR) repeat protein